MSATTTRDHVGRFVDRREAVLGRRLILAEEPSSAAKTLAALHGGERRAASWLRRVLAELGERTS